MKRYLSALIVSAGFFITSTGSAQIGQMGYGNSGNRAGMDRGIGVNQYGNGGKKKPTTGEKVDLLEQALNNLEKALTLDTFQKAVVKDFMEKNQTEETKVMNQEIPEQAKIEKFAIMREKLDDDIKKLLSKDQVDLFIKMKDKFDKKRS